MKKLFRENLLKAKVVISTEDALPYKEPDTVNVDPDVPLQPDNEIVTSPEVIDVIEDEIAAIEVDLIAIESLSSIPGVLAQHQNHADQEKAFLVTLESTLLDPQAARRILSTTVTGGISCSADIISLEETTGNAARSHWDSLINKINKLASANVGLVDDSESVGSGILEKMKGLKKQVQAYKGGRTVSVGRIAGSYKLDDLVRNTQAAIQEDIGMKLSFPLDSAVDELARMAAKAISSSASDGLAQVTAKGVKQADQMATQYKIRDPEFPILGYQRKTMDDQITLPQGIIMALSGSDRKYLYPRYVGLKGSAKASVELTPQQAKQLYDIGMFIGREIAEQSRVWEFRLGTLKALLGLAKNESRNVDADRNTWAAEQKAAAAVVRMWSTNAAARRHYVATYNKIAYLIFELLSSATGSNIEPSQEFMGLFGGKNKTLSSEEAIAYIKANINKELNSVTTDVSLLGGSPNSKNIEAAALNTIKFADSLVKASLQPFEKAYRISEQFNGEVIDEDELETQTEAALKPFMRHIGGGQGINGYRVWVTQSGSGIEGEFKKLPVNRPTTPIVVEPTIASKLLSHIESLKRSIDSLLTIKFPEYSQHHYEWVDPLRQMLQATQKQLIELCLALLGSNQQISQEFFGPFKKKPKVEPKAEPKVEGKPRATYVDPKSMLAQLPKAKIDPDVSHNLVAYSNSFPEHVKLLTKAAAEVNAKFNIANIKKFGVELNKLADQVMESFKHGDSDNDWKTEGNKALQMLLTEVEEQRLWGRFFGIDNIGGVFETSFKTASNVRWDNKESTERIPNANLGKQSVSGVDLTSATQLCKLAIAFPDPGEVNGVAQNNKFLKSFPKFDDAMYYHFEEPIQDVLMQLDDIIGNSYDLLLLAAKPDHGDHEPS